MPSRYSCKWCQLLGYILQCMLFLLAFYVLSLCVARFALFLKRFCIYTYNPVPMDLMRNTCSYAMFSISLLPFSPAFSNHLWGMSLSVTSVICRQCGSWRILLFYDASFALPFSYIRKCFRHFSSSLFFGAILLMYSWMFWALVRLLSSTQLLSSWLAIFES